VFSKAVLNKVSSLHRGFAQKKTKADALAEVTRLVRSNQDQLAAVTITAKKHRHYPFPLSSSFVKFRAIN
jgi:hypothetical protein